MQVITEKWGNCCGIGEEDLKRFGEGGNMKAKEIGNGEGEKGMGKKI